MKQWKKILAVLAILAAPIAHSTLTDQRTRTVYPVGNGVTTNFTIGFTFQNNTEVVVYRVNSSTGAAETIQQGVGANKFTITGGDPGTTVVMGTAPSSTQYIIIVRSTPKKQTVVYDENSAFPAADHTEQMDRFVQMLQELAYDTSIKIGFSAANNSSAPYFPVPLANRFIIYDSAAQDLTYAPPASEALASGQVLRYNGSTWSAFDLNTALSAITVDISGIESDIVTMQGDISDLQDDVAALTGGGGGGSSSFITISTPNGTSPVADSSIDTLTLASSDSSVVITGNSTTDTVNLGLGTVAITNGGTGMSSYTKGDMIYASANNVLSKLTGNSTNVRQFLTQTGDSAFASAPVWTVPKAPTVQIFTSGSGLYTTPTNPSPLYVNILVCGGGGGGGGGGAGTGGGNGGPGGISSFGTFLSGGGGAGGTGGSNAIGAGSIGTGGGGPNASAPAVLVFGVQGAHQTAGSTSAAGSQGTGGVGGVSFLGGPGPGAQNNAVGGAAAPNSASGGGGGGSGSAGGFAGGGGAAGGCVRATVAGSELGVNKPVTVGSGGTGGTAANVSTEGYTGGAGAAGRVVVEEYYQ